MRTPDSTKVELFLFLGDICYLFMAIHLAVFLRYQTWVPVWSDYTGAMVFSLIIFLLVFYIADLYSLANALNRRQVHTIIGACVIASCLSAAVFYALPNWRYPRGIFLLHLFLSSCAILFWRFIAGALFPVLHRKNNIIILGAGASGTLLSSQMKDSATYHLLGFLDDDPRKKDTLIDGLPVLGDLSMLPALAQEEHITTAVIAVTDKKNETFFSSVLAAKQEGISIRDMPSFFGTLTGRLPLVAMRDSWIVNKPFYGMDKNAYTTHSKRIFDIILALGALVFFSPVLLFTALCIPLESPGPVLYRQNRTGRGGRIFSMLKFRSMRQESENEEPVWAAPDDKRVTRVGRFIRFFRVDELPQMWNVLKGDMSVVGPRPERPEFVTQLAQEIPYYTLRHSVPPGITGWAQINFRYGASINDARTKLEFDLYYIKNLSVFFDIAILFKTIRIMLLGSGAR